jgi:hypothetical protein
VQPSGRHTPRRARPPWHMWGCRALVRGLFLLRCLRSEGAAGKGQAAAGLGAAGRRGTLPVAVGVLWYTSSLWYYNGFELSALQVCRSHVRPAREPPTWTVRTRGGISSPAGRRGLKEPFCADDPRPPSPDVHVQDGLNQSLRLCVMEMRS